MNNFRNRRAFTLIECLIYCALWAILAIGTMRVIGDARMLRSNARDRMRLALIAQSEIDKLRGAPASERKAGVETLKKPEWPEGTELQVEMKPGDVGTWTVEVRAARASIEGKPSVRLVTLLTGATP